MSQFLEHIGFLEVFFCRHRCIAWLGVNPKRNLKRSALFLDFDHAMPIATVHRNWFVLGGLVFVSNDKLHAFQTH